MRTIDLYKKLLRPSEDLISDMRNLGGDVLILGVGGKMGPALAKLAREAVNAAGVQKKKVMGAARFSEPGLRDELEQQGIETFSVDLLDESALAALPDVKNVLYLAGTKFG